MHIMLAGLVDINAEITRSNKDISKLKTEIDRTKTKLNNSNYITKAPADVVAKDRTALTLQKIQIHFQKLQQQ